MNDCVNGNLQFFRRVFPGALLLSCGILGLGFTWISSQPAFSTEGIAAAAFGNGRFVVVGYAGSLFISEDSTNWAAHSAGSTALFGTPGYLAFLDSNFFAVGTVGGNAVAQMSPDGLNWSNPVLLGAGSLSKVVFGNGAYVGVGQTGTSGLIARSVDGTHWSTQVITNTGPLNSVAFGNGTFVVPWSVYDAGTATYLSKVFTSTNGQVWIRQKDQSGMSFASLVYGNGIFLGAGFDNLGGPACLRSRDGVVWWGPTAGASDVLVGNTVFLGDRPTEIIVSTDGVNWQRALGTGEHTYYTPAYLSGRFFLFGASVLQSEDLRDYSFLSGTTDSTGAFHLTVTDGQTERGYRIQSSTDLTGTNWVDVFSFTNSLTTEFLDSGATNYLQRFYRVVSP